MKKITLVLYLFALTFACFGQKDSSWNVLLLEKGNEFQLKQNMYDFSKTGFYLFRNCVYEIELKNKTRFTGRLVAIQPDTLFFTNFFNANVAKKANAVLDTLALYYQELGKLNLIADRSLRIYSNYSFDKFDFIFKKDTANFLIESEWAEIYTNDSIKVEIVPHLTSQGVTRLFEENGRLSYFYGGGLTKQDYSKKIDTIYRKKSFFSLTPCSVEEINGFALGLMAKNWKNDSYDQRDSLIVRGLNVQIDPFSIVELFTLYTDGPDPDRLDLYYQNLRKEWELKIHGLNISAINTINEARISGLNITGGITVVDEINGMTISGINNFSYIMNGISIAGIRNRATLTKGIQIGLINKSTELRGIQIGLWNINGRRSLPFFNWQFKAKRKKEQPGNRS